MVQIARRSSHHQLPRSTFLKEQFGLLAEEGFGLLGEAAFGNLVRGQVMVIFIFDVQE